MCSCPAGISARRSAGLPVVHLSQLKPCSMSQAMPCFSSITAMACAVSIGRIALAAALGVGGERLLELIGEAEVIHHQPAGLVAEDAVHAGDGLHQAVALHRLVGIHRVQAGRVEAGQPHVAHDHDAERVLGVLEAVRQLAALAPCCGCAAASRGRPRRCRSSPPSTTQALPFSASSSSSALAHSGRSLMSAL